MKHYRKYPPNPPGMPGLWTVVIGFALVILLVRIWLWL